MKEMKRLHKYKTRASQAGAFAYAQMSGEMFCLRLAGTVKPQSCLSQTSLSARARHAYDKHTRAYVDFFATAAMRHQMHNSENLFTWRPRLHFEFVNCLDDAHMSFNVIPYI